MVDISGKTQTLSEAIIKSPLTLPEEIVINISTQGGGHE